MVESIIGEVGARRTDFLPKSYEVSSSSIPAPLVAVCKGFDAYGTLSGCLEDGTMANKHVFTCGTKTFPLVRTIFRERFELPEKKCTFYLSLSLSLSLWMEKLFNGIKRKTIKYKYKAYKLGFVQKI